MSRLDQYRPKFLAECEKNISLLNDGIAALRNGRHDAGTNDDIFRAVHSIKGGAGMFQFGRIASFAEEFEAAVLAVRASSSSLWPALVASFETASNVLADLIEAELAGIDLVIGYEKAASDTLETMRLPGA